MRARYLVVDVAKGVIHTVSPRFGRPNLLVGPEGIAVDPATGRQSEVQAGPLIGPHAPLDVGTSPAAIGIQQSTPAVGQFRTLRVASEGAVYEVDSDLLGISSHVLVSDAEIASPRAVAVAPSGGAATTIYLSGAGGVVSKRVQYDIGTTTFTDLVDGTNDVLGLDYADGAGLYYTALVAGCGGASGSGIFRPVGVPVAQGDLLSCPHALAVTGATSPISTVDCGNGCRLVAVDPHLACLPSLVASLTFPPDHYPGIAVATFAPEPGATTGTVSDAQLRLFTELCGTTAGSAILLSHGLMKGWDAEWPVSVSAIAIGALREQVPDALLVTDDLQMRGLPCATVDATVRALGAGADLACIGNNLRVEESECFAGAEELQTRAGRNEALSQRLLAAQRRVRARKEQAGRIR